MRPFLPTAENQTSHGGGQSQDGARVVTGENDKSPHILCSEIKAVWCDHLTDALPLSGRSTTLSIPSKAETPMS